MNSNSDASKNNRGLVINHLIDQAFNLALLLIGIVCTVESLKIVIKFQTYFRSHPSGCDFYMTQPFRQKPSGMLPMNIWKSI